jgi:hypothetical protein
LSAAIFSLKAVGLRGKRFVTDRKLPLLRFGSGRKTDYPVLLAELRSPLWTTESIIEAGLQQGKVQNLRRACGKLNFVVVPAGAIFSFWKQIGKATRSAGYVEGRELRQGCLIPSVGGGLCQLSNALYDLALQSGCEIVERHAHTAVVPGSAAEQGRDATVFWNYVDFRFRPQQDILITSTLSRHELVLTFRGRSSFQVLPVVTQASQRTTHSPDTCTDCHEENCFRHRPPAPVDDGLVPPASVNSAFLIEECWPEFQSFVAKVREEQNRLQRDQLFLPFRSAWWSPPRYGWEGNGFSLITAATLPTALAAFQTKLGLRRFATPVEMQIEQSNRLADFYGRRLPPSVTHLYIAQSLVPALWKRGELGGRSFSILMSRLPMVVLHKKLDEMAARYPDRATFREFRAPDWMVEAETEALEAAGEIITPHSLLAQLYPRKTQKIAWKVSLPSLSAASSQLAPGLAAHSPAIVFPGPALARKGAFELREAVLGLSKQLEPVQLDLGKSVNALPFRILTLGQALETPGFWQQLPVQPAGEGWLQRASAVVQPAFVENNPRALLRALSAGIPVIATPECGINGLPNLTLITAGDVQALREALGRVLYKR